MELVNRYDIKKPRYCAKKEMGEVLFDAKTLLEKKKSHDVQTYRKSTIIRSKQVKREYDGTLQ